MKIEEVIECLNKSIEEKRRALKIHTKGHLVLQKTVEKTQVNVYKKITYTLWFIKGKEKYIVIKREHTCRVLNNNLESIIADIEKEFVTNLLGYIYNCTYFKEIVKGEYKGFEVLMTVKYGRNEVQ